MTVTLDPLLLAILAVIIGIGVLGGVFVIVRLAYTTTTSMVLLQKMQPIMEELQTLAPVIFAIAKQFTNDHGSTARDEMNRNTAQGVTLAADVVTMSKQIGDLRAEQTQLALEQSRQPATTQSIHIGQDLVAHDKTENQK